VYMIDLPTAVRDLEPLTVLLYEGFEGGLSVTREFFETHGAPICKHLGPAIVRWYVKRFLSDRGHVVQELQQQDMNNNGLGMRFQPYYLRIWKSDDGQLPYPGQSRTKRDFLYQAAYIPFRWNWSPPKTNLVFLWSTDSEYQGLQLYLACPKENPAQEGAVATEWGPHPLEHPVMRRTAPALSEPPVIDLPYEYKNDSEVEGHDLGGTGATGA